MQENKQNMAWKLSMVDQDLARMPRLKYGLFDKAREIVITSLSVVGVEGVIMGALESNSFVAFFRPGVITVDQKNRIERKILIYKEAMEKKPGVGKSSWKSRDKKTGLEFVVQVRNIHGMCLFVGLVISNKQIKKLSQRRIRRISVRFLNMYFFIMNEVRHFPPSIVRWYFESGVGVGGNRIPPPFSKERKGDLRSATLSIDMRRSTFSMDHADTDVDFAKWIDVMVAVLTEVARRNGGIFDKFTGDGVLVHFLERECASLTGKSAVFQATRCALEMLEGVAVHLKALKTFLRFDSNIVGAGVGIDLAENSWHVDRSGSPIVVGRGVVGACRITEEAKKEEIILTNIAARELWGGMKVTSACPRSCQFIRDERKCKVRMAGRKGMFEKREFKSKEFREEDEVFVWKITSKGEKMPQCLRIKRDEIKKIVKKIYDEMAYPSGRRGA